MPVSDPITNAEFREIPESEGYRFGSDGSIWSRWGKGRDRPDGPWTQLNPWTHKSGHLNVEVKFNGTSNTVGAHHLVCLAFHGPRPPGLECLHRDGNPANNRADNLHWGTRQENIDDQKRHGVMVRGERVGIAKLTEEKVRQIRELHATGQHTLRGLGEMFGVAHCTVKYVVRRETWRHVA